MINGNKKNTKVVILVYASNLCWGAGEGDINLSPIITGVDPGGDHGGQMTPPSA